MGSSLPLMYPLSVPCVISRCSWEPSELYFKKKKKLLLFVFSLKNPPQGLWEAFSSVEGFIYGSPRGVSYSESHSLAALFFVSLLPTSHLSALWVPEMKNPAMSSLLVSAQLT